MHLVNALDGAWHFALHSSSPRAADMRVGKCTDAITLASSNSTSSTSLTSSDISSGYGRGVVNGLGLPERHISQHSMHLSELASRASHLGSHDDHVEDDPWQWPFLAPRLSVMSGVASSSHTKDVCSSFALPRRDTYRSTVPSRASTSSEETTTNESTSGTCGASSSKKVNGKQLQHVSLLDHADVTQLPSSSHRQSESFLDLGGVSVTIPASRQSVAHSATSSEHKTNIHGHKGIQVQIEDLSLELEHAEAELAERQSMAKRESMIGTCATAENTGSRGLTYGTWKPEQIEKLLQAVAFYQRDCKDATKDCAYWQNEYLLLLKQYRTTKDLANRLKARVQAMERRERRLKIVQQLKTTAHVGNVLGDESFLNDLPATLAKPARSTGVNSGPSSSIMAERRNEVCPNGLPCANKDSLQPEAAFRRSPMVLGRRRSSSCVLTGDLVQQGPLQAMRRPVTESATENEAHGHIAQWLLDARADVARQYNPSRQEDDPLSPISPAAIAPPKSVARQRQYNAENRTLIRLRHPFSTSRSEPSIADMNDDKMCTAQLRPKALQECTNTMGRAERAFKSNIARPDSDAGQIIDFHGFDVRATLPASLSKLLSASTPSVELEVVRDKGRHPFTNLVYNHAR